MDTSLSVPADRRRYMDEGMFAVRFSLILFATLLCGCASTNAISESAFDAISEPKFLKTMEDVDAIQIEELTLTGRKHVSRFVDVCRNAKWAPYVATMPAKIETVKFMSDGVETHQLLYAGGWLFDMSGDGAQRFGTIHADDGDWFDENVDTQLMLLRNAF